MDPITVSITIGRPREEVFSYLVDIANHAEFSDHYLHDWHLTRENPVGRGAGARFRVATPCNRFSWADVTFSEVEPPYRIVEAGRAGKTNRILTLGVYELTEASAETTHVTFTFETEPRTPSDRLMESMGARAWLRRKNAKALRRLRSILEEGEQRGQRVTIAGQ